MNSINSTNRLNIRRSFAGIAGVIITLAIPYFIGLSDPHIESSQSLCPFKMITGLPCPGCGITKSLIFLYQGDLSKSLYYHILGIPLVLFCLGITVLLVINMISGKLYLRRWLFSSKLAYGMAAVLMGYHAFRLVDFISRNSLNEILVQSIWK